MLIHWDERLSKLYLMSTVPLTRISMTIKTENPMMMISLYFCIQHVKFIWLVQSAIIFSFSFHFTLQRKTILADSRMCIWWVIFLSNYLRLTIWHKIIKTRSEHINIFLKPLEIPLTWTPIKVYSSWRYYRNFKNCKETVSNVLLLNTENVTLVLE